MLLQRVFTERDKRLIIFYGLRCRRTWAQRSHSVWDHGWSVHWKNRHFWLLHPKNRRSGFWAVLDTRKAKGSLQKHMSGGGDRRRCPGPPSVGDASVVAVDPRGWVPPFRQRRPHRVGRDIWHTPNLVWRGGGVKIAGERETRPVKDLPG